MVGKQKGDEILVSLPDSKIEFEVLEVISIHDKLDKDDSE
jgi:transcription elongation GreA/GreB family factor